MKKIIALLLASILLCAIPLSGMALVQRYPNQER